MEAVAGVERFDDALVVWTVGVLSGAAGAGLDLLTAGDDELVLAGFSLGLAAEEDELGPGRDG